MRLTGKTQGLSPSRLKKLKRALKLAGVDKNVQVLSGRRSMASVKRIYQTELNRKRGYYSGGRKILIEDKSLNDFVKDLNPEIKKKVQHILLRTEYDGPFRENYEVPPVKYSRRGGKAIAKKDLKELFDKYDVSSDTRKEINNRLFEKLRVDGRTIGSLRDGFGGVESSHVQGDKIDLVLSEVPKPARNALESIGLKLLRERGKNVLDVNFKALDQLEDNFEYSPNVRENVLQSSMAKPKRSIPFKQAFNEARAEGKKEFTWKGNRYNTIRKEDLVKEEDLRGPEMQRDQYLEDQDDDLTEEIVNIKKEAKKGIVRDPYYGSEVEMPQPEIEPEEMPLDSPEPFGVYAKGTEEFDIAEEQEKDKLMMAAHGGEVHSKRFIASLPLEQRKKLANEELDEIGFKRIKEARKKRNVKKGFQAGRVKPKEVEAIEKKYGVWDEYADGGEVKYYEEGGEVDDVPEFLRRPPEDRQPEDFRIENVEEMDIEESEPEPEPKPEPMPEPDLSGPEFDRDQYLMEQKSTQELMDYGIPGEDRPLAVNRELIRRKKEAQSGFKVGKGPTLKEIAKQEESDTMVMEDDVTVKKRPPVKKDTRGYFRKLFEESESLREKDEADLRKREDEILAIVEKPIDPKRLYKKMGTFDKVVGLLGLAAGAYDSFKYGGPNFYLKQLNKAVDDDIKEQQLERKESQYKKAQMLFNAKILAGRLARATKDRDKKSNFLKLENTFDKAYKKQLKGQNEKVRKIKFIETLNKRGLTSREVAYADSIHPELKVGNKVIKGRDGLYYYTRGDVKKLKEYISDAQDSIDGLAELEEYVDKVSLLEQIPGASIISADAAGAQSLRDRLVGKLRIEFFGPGVMTDNEREQAKKILGDPNAFWSRDSVEKEKIRNLLLKINYGIRQKLRRDGLAIPESQNDRKVKAWLKRGNKALTDRNKALAVNALITAEKKHVRLGGKPGKHWNIEEPLPI